MDVRQVRHAANQVIADIGGTNVRARWACQQLLRILDAFEAMERERWFIDISPTMGTWYAMGGEGSVITEGHKTPLAALLAAATVEGKTDVV